MSWQSDLYTSVSVVVLITTKFTRLSQSSGLNCDGTKERSYVKYSTGSVKSVSSFTVVVKLPEANTTVLTPIYAGISSDPKNVIVPVKSSGRAPVTSMVNSSMTA